jgi:hypothetical protein
LYFTFFLLYLSNLQLVEPCNVLVFKRRLFFIFSIFNVATYSARGQDPIQQRNFGALL